MMKQVSQLLSVLLLLLLLAACVPVTTPVIETPPNREEATSVPMAATAFPVTLEHQYGSVTIPAAPERIIAMNEGVMANLLALGVVPAGVVDYASRDYTQYLGDTTTTVASVGTADGPNFEAMLALQPDLILAMQDDVDEETLALLAQIAPVAVSTAPSTDWRGCG